MLEDYTEEIAPAPEEIIPEPFISTICTITLADGVTLTDLELNGNNYIAPGIIDDSVFADNLDTVEITQTRGEETATATYHNMRLVQNTTMFSGGLQSWFVLAEIPQEEIDRAALESRLARYEADTAYLSMMTGVEL